MKKFILAALAATVATAPVMAAPYYGDNDRGRTAQTHRTTIKQGIVQRNDHGHPAGARKWQRGQRFDSRYAQNYRVISSPRAYRLQNAPRGYRWVQSGSDAVLVGVASGMVASLMENIIR